MAQRIVSVHLTTLIWNNGIIIPFTHFGRKYFWCLTFCQAVLLHWQNFCTERSVQSDATPPISPLCQHVIYSCHRSNPACHLPMQGFPGKSGFHTFEWLKKNQSIIFGNISRERHEGDISAFINYWHTVISTSLWMAALGHRYIAAVQTVGLTLLRVVHMWPLPRNPEISTLVDEL